MQLYGKEKWLLAFLRHLDRERFRSCVVTLTREGEVPLADRLRDDGIVVFDVRSSGRFSREALRTIRGIIAEKEIDIVHSHDYKADLTAILCARKTGAATVSTPHGWSMARDLKLKSYQALDQLILRYFNFVVPLSPSLSASLRYVNEDRKILINNFVDLSAIPDSREFDKSMISYIGRLIPIKRVEDIITAVSMMRNEEIRLQVIGDGPLLQNLEDLAAKLGVAHRVSFLGFRKDALELLGKSSILVLSSITEGMPRTGMEAMAMGKPVIGSDIPGIRALVKNGHTGMLFPVKEPEAIAEQVDRLLEDNDLYSSISSNAAAFIKKNHSAAVAVKKYEELYDRCITSGRN